MKKLMTTRRVREEFGGVTSRTILRWEQQPNLGFPTPIYINRRKYHDEDAIAAFKRLRAAAKEG